MTYVLEKQMIGASAFYAFTDMHTGRHRWTDKPEDGKAFATHASADFVRDRLGSLGVVVTKLVSPAERG